MSYAVIYCRVSTEDQAEHGFSLDAQEKLCRDFAQRNEYEVKGVFRDEGKSGKSLDRPALQDLLTLCGQDSTVNAVIVQETDRLARNTQDHLAIRSLLRKAEVKLISVAQPMLDESPEGKMVDTILASVNQFQSDLSARKIRRALQEKFDTGWWPCAPPLGYRSLVAENGSSQGRKVVVKDPDTWPLVREAFTLYLTGSHSVEAVNDTLYEHGLRTKSGKKLSRSVMTKVLRNPFYAGQLRWKGQLRTGSHEAMITESERQRVLDILDRHINGASRRRQYDFLLRGFVFCGICGGRYTAEVHPRKRKSYYHCTAHDGHSNRGQNVAAHVLEAQVAEHFHAIELNETVVRKALAYFKSIVAEERTRSNAERKTLWNKRKAILTSRDRLEEKMLKGVLDDTTFSRLRTKLQSELVIIESRLHELERSHDAGIDVLRTAATVLSNVGEGYDKASYELKRQYMGVFWDRFVVQDRRIIEAVPSRLVQTLHQAGGVVINTSGMWRCPTDIITLLSDRKYMKEVGAKIALLSQGLAAAGITTEAA